MSKKVILKNVLMNFLLMVVFVGLNNWALKNSLEETFIFLALIYGILTIILNALFVGKIDKI